jgi:hypothetical protein
VLENLDRHVDRHGLPTQIAASRVAFVSRPGVIAKLIKQPAQSVA